MDEDALPWARYACWMAAQETKVPEYFESLAKSYDLNADEAERISASAQQAVSSVFSDGG